nr:MAG TPA: hypothetical protein [Caudoviricetes sp.]
MSIPIGRNSPIWKLVRRISAGQTFLGFHIYE